VRLRFGIETKPRSGSMRPRQHPEQSKMRADAGSRHHPREIQRLVFVAIDAERRRRGGRGDLVLGVSQLVVVDRPLAIVAERAPGAELESHLASRSQLASF
jgi:hypothetical protein